MTVLFVLLGFGSSTLHKIQHNGVHYDCGCIISQNGELMRYQNRWEISDLNVPAVYVVYFSTFGALVCSCARNIFDKYVACF